MEIGHIISRGSTCADVIVRLIHSSYLCRLSLLTFKQVKYIASLSIIINIENSDLEYVETTQFSVGNV